MKISNKSILTEAYKFNIIPIQVKIQFPTPKNRIINKNIYQSNFASFSHSFTVKIEQFTCFAFALKFGNFNYI
jgi:hypothetical protein